MGNFCYRCMLPTVTNGVCTKCGEPEASANSNGDNALPPGTALGKGRLTVGKKLGSGGFGVTYVAYDNKLKRRVALKEFMPNYLAVRQGMNIVPKSGQNEAYQKAMNSFMKEARALYELRAHPNIVHVLSVFKENNTAYYTMEMLEGESFLDYLKRKKKISANRAFQMLLPIMRAIQYIHSRKMIHRDISPDNIMLCENSSRPGSVIPKLIDFGAAHVAIEGYSLSYPGVKKNGFSPLEQNWEGKSQGPWTDVYSFCATFYSAIIGNVPVAAQTRAEADKDPLRPPKELGADIIPEMQDVLMRGLKLRYEERIQTMDQLIEQMSRAVENTANSTVVEVAAQTGTEPKRPAARRVFSWLLEIALEAGGIMLLKDSDLFSKIGLNGDPFLLSLLSVPLAAFLLDLLLLVSVGSTIGQLFFGIRIRGEDGEGNPGFFNAMAYSLFYASAGMPIGALLGFIWLVSGKHIGPLESLTGVNVGLRKRAEQMQNGISGVISRGVNESVQKEQAPAMHSPEPAIPKESEKVVPQPPAAEEKELSAPQKPVSGSDHAARPGYPPSLAPGARPPVQPPKPRPSGLSGASGTSGYTGVSGTSGQSRAGTPAAQARLVCLTAAPTAAELKGKAVIIRSGIKLGKSSQKANIIIPDQTVSGLHCSFHYVPEKGWMIRDENSTNGTFVNGNRLTAGGTAPLRDGVTIKAGKEMFEFKC